MKMLPLLSPSLKEKDGTKWMAALGGVLVPGETVQAFARVSSLRPLAECMAVTESRVVLFSVASVGTKGLLLDIGVSEIHRCEVKMKAAGRTVVLFDGSGNTRSIALVRSSDADFVVQQINAVARAVPPRAPTVDVYDPFTKPWAEPESANQVVDSFVAPPPPVKDVRSVSDEVSPMATGSVADDVGNEPKRLVPLWKTIPAWAFAVFCLLGVIAAIFADGPHRLGVGLFYLTMLLIPLLALSRARRNVIRKRAESDGTEASYGFVERNWFPIGIPVILAIFVLSFVVR